MTSKKLDLQNPGCIVTFALFKKITEMEWNILESCKGIDISGVVPGAKPKIKRVYNTVRLDTD